MQITEEKIRQIVRETQYHLGPNTDPAMIKKVVKEVVRRLREEAAGRERDRDP